MNESHDDNTPIWGAENIGAEIGKSEAGVYRLMKKEPRFPVGKCGGMLVTTRKQLRQYVEQKIAERQEVA